MNTNTATRVPGTTNHKHSHRNGKVTVRHTTPTPKHPVPQTRRNEALYLGTVS